MPLLNNNFMTFGGDSVTGRVPTQLIVKPSLDTGKTIELSPQLYGAVSHAYKLFCDAVNASPHAEMFHVQNRKFPDGSKARFESNLGVHRVIVWPVGGGGDRYPVNTFFCIPFDESYYTDRVEDVYYLERWPDIATVFPHTLLDKLRRLGGDEDPPLKRMLPVNGKKPSHPGNTNWFPTNTGGNHKFEHIVLSWWGPNTRYGHGQGFATNAKLWSQHLRDDGQFYWTPPTNSLLSPPMAHIHRNTVANQSLIQVTGTTVPPDHFLWINSRHVALPFYMMSACVALTEDGRSVVRILVNSGASPLPTHLFEVPLRTMIDLSIDGGSLTEEMGDLTALPAMAGALGVSSVLGLTQPPYWNSSGTEAVGIAHVRVTEGSGSLNASGSGTLSRTSGTVGLVAFKYNINSGYEVLERSVYNMDASYSTTHVDPYPGLVIEGFLLPSHSFPYVDPVSSEDSPGSASAACSFSVTFGGNMSASVPMAIDFYGDDVQLVSSNYTEGYSYNLTGSSDWSRAASPTAVTASLTGVVDCAESSVRSSALTLNGVAVIERNRTETFSSDGNRAFSGAGSYAYTTNPDSTTSLASSSVHLSDLSVISAEISLTGRVTTFVLSAGDLRGGKIIVQERNLSRQIDRILPTQLRVGRSDSFYSELDPVKPTTISHPRPDGRELVHQYGDISGDWVGGGSVEFTCGCETDYGFNGTDSPWSVVPQHDIAGGFSYEKAESGVFIFDSLAMTYEQAESVMSSSGGAQVKQGAYIGVPSKFAALQAPRTLEYGPLKIGHPDFATVEDSPWEIYIGIGGIAETTFSGASTPAVSESSLTNEAGCMPRFMAVAAYAPFIPEFPAPTASSFSFTSNGAFGMNGQLNAPRLGNNEGRAVFSASALSPDGKIQYLGYLFDGGVYQYGVWGTPYTPKANKWFAEGEEFTPSADYPKNGEFKGLSSPIFTGPLPPKKEFPWLS